MPVRVRIEVQALSRPGWLGSRQPRQGHPRPRSLTARGLESTMTRFATRTRPAWDDRWSQPTVKDLLSPHSDQHRKVIESLMEVAEELPDVQKSLIWYGAAWKWTVQYVIRDAKGRDLDTLCYIVPRVDAPMLCVPLTDAQIARLPMKRLPKLVRDGVRGAKCAVSMHWATWTPTLQAEVTQLVELLRRKHKLLTAAGDEAEQN